MKSKSTQKTFGRKLPYQKRKDIQSGSVNSSSKAIQTSSLSTSLPSTDAASAAPSPSLGLERARETYVDSFQRKYPNMEPRNDYELLTLAQRKVEGTPAELRAWVDDQLLIDIQCVGTKEAVYADATKVLDNMVGQTGRKPRPGRDIMHTCQIPGSKYSIRLWPGNLYVNEYCMDFVNTETKEAVNTPFELELWAVPDPDAPWLAMSSGRLYSLEHNFHVARDKILPGLEKWVLRDGQTCLLKRPGKKDVFFRVPVRRNPTTIKYDADVLEFPREV
ncbi:hypothetical protein VTO73DRAFT_4968 [Trametes versicolor]